MAIFHSSKDAIAAAASARSFEFDFAGSGGSLSNGTIAFNGYSWTLFGVGAATGKHMGFYIPAKNLVSSYDGSKHYVEVALEWERVALTQSFGLLGIGRGSVPPGKYNSTWCLKSSNTSAQYGAVSNVGAGEATQSSIQNYSTFEPTRMAIGCNGRTTVSTHTAGPTGKARLAQTNTGLTLQTINGAQTGITSPWGTEDVVFIDFLAYAGANLTTTATQSASGITLVLGTSTVIIKKFYVYIGEETIP